MRNPLTLFHRRDADEVFVRRLDFPGSEPADRRALLVYSREPLKETLLDLSEVGDPAALAQRVTQLRGALTHGGGILAVIEYSELGSHVMIYVEGASQSFPPPEEIVFLRPGVPPSSQRLPARKIDLRVGEHLILPIDDEAEKKLGALLDHLGWLPPDLEATMQNMLRRPSFEGRIERVEELLEGARNNDRASLGERLAGPVPLWAFLVSILLLVALGAFQLIAPGTVGGAREPAAEMQGHTVSGAMRLIAQSLGQARESPLAELYESHFKGSRNMQRKLPKDQDAVWGIIKLLLLKEGRVEGDLIDLLASTREDASPFKVMLSPQGNIDLGENEWKMLYHLTCQAFSKACTKSCLPYRENEVLSEMTLLKDAPECRDAGRAMVVPAVTALQELNDYIPSR